MDYKWEVLSKESASNKSRADSADIVEILLKNRGIKTKKEREEFFNPIRPQNITINSLDLSKREIGKAITRIKIAKEKGEKVVVYGDYDADGICATAVLWECLYALGVDVAPYIPERFFEGYGLNAKSIEKLKAKNPELKLIITVDNGIVANEAVNKADKLGVEVIITDHHQKGKLLPKVHSIIHTTKTSGAGIAWILAREISKQFPIHNSQFAIKNGLDLAAMGTIADQIPLIGINRSFVKYGLEVLNETKRWGLLALFKEAGLEMGNLGTYEVGFIIAPRINAMGRLKHAMESLRLLCTLNKSRAKDLAFLLGETNKTRQEIVEEVVLHTKAVAEKRAWQGVIVVAHESYHEGVIGLAASKLVDEFYRPAIVLSQGKDISKASARSISGFNIIEAIRAVKGMSIKGGGHPMAAGFSIATDKIEKFSQKLEKLSSKLLTQDILSKKLKIDMEVGFDGLDKDLLKAISFFEPTGLGNPTPTFATNRVSILEIRPVGFEKRHLKLALEKDGQVFSAIAFNFGKMYTKLLNKPQINVAYNFEENVWNGRKTMQLKIKDIKICSK